jgi:hypothetical protein
MTTDKSPYIVHVGETETETKKYGGDPGNPWQTYLLGTVAVLLVLYIFYYSYTCFCNNQHFDEPFIEKTIKTGIDDDRSFDVDVEVKRLSDIQEQYLRKLNTRRNF